MLRLERKLSREDAADLCGIKPSTFADICRGTIPGADHIMKICAAFQVPLMRFFVDEGEMVEVDRTTFKHLEYLLQLRSIYRNNSESSPARKSIEAAIAWLPDQEAVLKWFRE